MIVNTHSWAVSASLPSRMCDAETCATMGNRADVSRRKPCPKSSIIVQNRHTKVKRRHKGENSGALTRSFKSSDDSEGLGRGCPLCYSHPVVNLCGNNWRAWGAAAANGNGRGEGQMSRSTPIRTNGQPGARMHTLRRQTINNYSYIPLKH